ncbi:MAG: bifunctional [glutamine synthetase] adenylyltransferase/[glutamine synthetase]-adenylyl-L-tyrosine phosphorylase [bacterium]|nr:bifunctional [glutamine synthetase] adenylyltransferase/[glutamine synthetase]-adenylyl-L-tyrosine phosphorylase [bacterium]
MIPFYTQIKLHPPFYDLERAQMFFDDLLKACADREELSALHEFLMKEEPVKQLIVSVMGLSPFLRAIMIRQPHILLDCLRAPANTHLEDLFAQLHEDIASCTSMAQAMTLLRRFKQNTALTIALYDIAGIEPVEHIVRRITIAADCAVQSAVGYLFRQSLEAGQIELEEGADAAASSGYFVLAMGKQGGFELNYSSDIDLIVLYDNERLNLAEGVEAQTFFVRLTRDLVKLLNERTKDGYVYRTDLRLRPDPGATQLAISSEAALVYYESYGQNWERAAMIKARVVAGDLSAGEDFLGQLSPYIWRKYLDFAAINDIHAMKRQIHAFKGHGQVAVAGHNIKLGRGGIREIEFFVQTQQLIAGGRQPDLRGRSTLHNLEQLLAHGWINADAARQMAAAYRFLRHVEHRLQMVDDAQTQTLPTEQNELLQIARFSGFETGEEFASTLISHLQNVQSHYGALFEDMPELADTEPRIKVDGDLVFTGDDHHPATVQNLVQMGYENPGGAINIVGDWHRSRYAAMRSLRAREALTQLTPLLLNELAATSNPDAALIAFDRFLKRLPAGVQLFSLLRANPELLRLIAEIMGTAPRLAHVLSYRANMLDAVLEPSFFGVLPSRTQVDQVFDSALQKTSNYSEILDFARIAGRELAFLTGVRVLTDTISPDQAGAAYADLAASVISHLHTVVNKEIERVHGQFTAGTSCVLAMGKVGGAEMTASSDLDLIVIYDVDQHQTMSSGTERPLGASQYYNRLTQRLITAISAPTPEGMLYEVDMRLRPSGNAGPVATNLESFAAYQKDKAWTWEHMALTRARIVSGPAGLSDKLNTIILDVLCAPRDQRKLANDVIEMRERIFAKKGSDHLWDIKQVRGGLIDLEFLVQYLQLVHANNVPQCLDQNTSGALRKLASNGVLDWGVAEILIDGAWRLHTLTQILRLCTDKPFDAATAPLGLKNLLVRATNSPDFARLEARLVETQADISALFKKHLVDSI